MQITPANRVNNVQEYYFSRKLREIAQMRAEGKDVLNLGIGSPDLPPSQATIETLSLEAQNPGNHGYQSYTGIPELREAFAQWYQSYYNVTIDPANQVLPLIGSKEGILHISMAFLNPGDQVLVPNPGYPTYQSVSRLVEAEICTYDLKESNNWEPDFDALEQTDLSRVKLMWVNYPNMPTGAPATIELYQRLIAFGKKHRIVIVNDNPYSFILNKTPLSILSVEGAQDIAIEMNSLSKSHNMAGWRMGVAISNPTFIQYILRVKSNVDSGTFRPTQLAAAQALTNPQEWYEGLNAEYLERRKIVCQIMDALACSYDESQTGMFIWARIPEQEECGETLAERMLHKALVFITPGFIFGSNGHRYIRISLCNNQETLQEALKRVVKTQTPAVNEETKEKPQSTTYTQGTLF